MMNVYFSVIFCDKEFSPSKNCKEERREMIIMILNNIIIISEHFAIHLYTIG